jgi:hypothetical protein
LCLCRDPVCKNLQQMMCEKSQRANLCISPLFCKQKIRHAVKILVANAVAGLGACARSGIHNLSGLGATFILFYLPAGHWIIKDDNLLRLTAIFKGTADLLSVVKSFTYYSVSFNKFHIFIHYAVMNLRVPYNTSNF